MESKHLVFARGFRDGNHPYLKPAVDAKGRVVKDVVVYHSLTSAGFLDVPTVHCSKCKKNVKASPIAAGCFSSSTSANATKGYTRFFRTLTLESYRPARFGRTAGRSRGRCRSTVAAARPVSAARRGRRLRGARGGGGGPSLRSIRRRTVNFFSNVLYGAVQPNWPIVGQQNRWFRKNVRPRFCPLHGFPPARRPRAPRTVRLASRALPLCGRLILRAWALALGPLT